MWFEWNDEHYKVGNPNIQDISYESNEGKPDGINDEEWLGFVDIDRVPKETVSGLKTRFELDGYIDIPLDGAPTIEALSEGDAATFKINGETIFSRSGGDGGGRPPHDGALLGFAPGQAAMRRCAERITPISIFLPPAIYAAIYAHGDTSVRVLSWALPEQQTSCPSEGWCRFRTRCSA